MTPTPPYSTTRFIPATLIAVLALSASAVNCSRRDIPRDNAAVSNLQFSDIDAHVQNGLSATELNDYSRTLAGTRVRWKGKVLDTDRDGTVYVLVNPATVSTPDAQFKLSGHAAQALKKGQEIRFTGTIEKVGILETFPPMPNTYVFLKDTTLE
jgi:hypothetical protein